MIAQLDRYVERNIKELLEEYPGLGDVLNGFGIGCVTCAAGSCALKDIVQYHYLPEEQQRALMESMARTIEGGGVAVPRQEMAEPRKIAYSAPMMDLVREHALIKRWLALIPQVLETIDLEADADRKLVRYGIGFIQTYADKYHHAKEEDILFKRFDETQEIIRVMLEDHTTGRGHVKAMLQALEACDKVMLAEHLLAYRDLLTEHIRKEDEILYPWMDRQFSPEQIETLQREFDQADHRFDPGMVRRFEEFIEGIERTAA
ncbi:MAG: hemerythrin domain-containing protein [Armatimonadota bacterium]